MQFLHCQKVHQGISIKATSKIAEKILSKACHLEKNEHKEINHNWFVVGIVAAE